jgi:saccharopine dehydrogenase (NAD+, L-lysine-forming)
MDACLETGVDYLDTANYEPPDVAKFEYKWQWAYHERYRKAGIMGLLGSGFDPGVTNVFCAHAQKHLFDTIHTVDILDCNAGQHGHAFATNFNPEINIREITAAATGERPWREGPIRYPVDDLRLPEIGARRICSITKARVAGQDIRGLRRIRFWMTFGDAYLTHLRVLETVGMTRIDPVDYEGHPVVPIKLLKLLLPDPASLAANYSGKTSIGCLIEGIKDGKPRKIFIYNNCDHAETYREVRSQAISYTTGVPAMVGAAMMVTGSGR